MSGGIGFTSFYLIIFFLTVTSLRHYCNILYVALLMPFSYYNKRLAQH